MKVGICAKVTADTDARLKPSADGKSFDATGKVVVGPYDMFAVEAAIQAKEKQGADVVSFTVGSGDEVLAQIRGTVLALGAGKAVLIDDPALKGTDSLGIARALAKAIAREGCELVFCGKQAIDDDNVQVPAMVAELLGWAQVSRVVEFALEGTTFTATRAMDGGVREVVTGALPVVITAERGLNTPRYAKLPAILAAKSKPVENLKLDALGLSAADVAPKATVTGYSAPPDRPKGKMITGDADAMVKELVRLLRDEAKVL
ncbi:MAG: electron transfer flavoprotein subunit beta/FixA family protein [Myxococcota bacterium]